MLRRSVYSNLRNSRNLGSRNKNAFEIIIKTALKRYERKNRYKSMSLTLMLTIIGFSVGVLATWIISDYFHGISIRQQKEQILSNTLYELKLNINRAFYIEFSDTSKYINAGSPFPYLQKTALDELYRKFYLYEISIQRDTLISKLVILKMEIEIFNDKVRLRNNYILIDPKNSKSFNQGAFDFYYGIILPKTTDFIEFIKANREILTS